MERDCTNCKHVTVDAGGIPCNECGTRANYWEPMIVTAKKTLQDFGFEPGTTEIWYCKHPCFCDPIVPSVETLSDTHELLGVINETDLNRIYDKMQGECWSPEGEAEEFITSLGLGHTSMSVQDVIRVNGTYYMVAVVGFKELKGGK